MIKSPAIIVIAFNRPHSLSRLLVSVSKANYPAHGGIPLCICIDYQDSQANREVVRIAETFSWQHGPKEVIYQNNNLGLKEHVLRCGDLTERFESIIMLEDDVYVSPAFYDYTLQALGFYEFEDRVAGISLYSHRFNVTGGLPFEAIYDGTDGYFLQVAASWGQAWNHNQWSKFRIWLDSNPLIPRDVNMSSYISNWPSTSWLKHFIHYLISTNRYFFYPRVGLSTNFSDAGSNKLKPVPYYQVPIAIRPKEFNFLPFKDSNCIYDSFFELDSECLGNLNPWFKEYSVELNLYGLKKNFQIKQDYVAVIGAHPDPLKSYGFALKPLHSNLVLGLEGKGISVIRKELISREDNPTREERRYAFDYFNRPISLKEKILNIIDVVVLKLLRILR